MAGEASRMCDKCGWRGETIGHPGCAWPSRPRVAEAQADRADRDLDSLRTALEAEIKRLREAAYRCEEENRRGGDSLDPLTQPAQAAAYHWVADRLTAILNPEPGENDE